MPQRDSANPKMPVQLLFMGSIDERKGIFDLLSCLTQANFDYHLTIAGTLNDPSNSSKFQKLCDTLNENVTYVGYIKGEEKNKLLEMCDINVLPSYAEGLPVTLIEGMCYGEAIVSTTVGATPEIIKPNFGILCQAGDTDAILNAINSICADRQLLRNMQLNSFKESYNFTIQSYVKSLCKDVLK
jgi:glycosyltransferase involved in cell wall biosynthesis